MATKQQIAARMAPTPFQIVGGAIKGAAKKVGGFVDKNFIEPTRNVNRIRNQKMQEMDRQAKAGEFN